MDNFKFIYKILSALEKSMDLEECNLYMYKKIDINFRGKI